jgi:hypothetical protein
LTRQWTTTGNTPARASSASGTLLLKSTGYIHASWNKKLLLWLLLLLLLLRLLLLHGGNNCLG